MPAPLYRANVVRDLLSSRFARFDVPIVLFGLSVLSGLFVAYDRSAADGRAVCLIAGLGLAWAISRRSWLSHVELERHLVRTTVALAPTLLAVIYVCGSDWTRPVGKVHWLDALQPWLALVHVDGLVAPPANAVGGLLAIWLPLQVAALRSTRATVPGWARAFQAALVAASAGALVLTRLRGAWLALLLALAGLAIARTLPRPGTLVGRRGVRWALGGAAIVATVAVVWAWRVSWPHLAHIRPDRAAVWGQSWDLAWDYALTGLGLNQFPMAYSSYELLLHVPHTMHAHNVWLDVWLEQGALGLAAFAWIAAAAFLPSGGASHGASRRWTAAARVSWAVTLLLGLVDDVHYGYGGLGTIVLVVPLAFLHRGPAPARRRVATVPWRAAAVGGVAMAIALAVAVALLPAVRATYHANRGALAQTRLELTRFRWPEWSVQDALRRSGTIDLSPAVDHFEAALEADATNVTANRRLGQIELSRGDYAAARGHLAAAFRAGPERQTTRRLLGESLAALGDVCGAAHLWREGRVPAEELAERLTWYTEAGPPEIAAQLALAVTCAEAGCEATCSPANGTASRLLTRLRFPLSLLSGI